MVSQQQATASIGILGLVLAYMLWAVIGTGAFLPYTSGNTPQISNIGIFLALVSAITGAFVAVFWSIGATLYSLIRRRTAELSGSSLWILFLVTAVSLFVALALHVFRLVPFWVSVLSCAIVCSIVGYGKYKEKTRNKKYTPASD